jgi:peptidoglycan hydrolase-like protein with peptidoglycan-binding domain
MRGIAGLLFESIQENPSIAAGMCTFAVAFSLVAGNALYGQKSVHPVPLFATRDAMTTRSVQKADRHDARKPVRRQGDIAHIPVPKARPQFAPQPANASTLVRDTQEGLRAKGLYDGTVDGLYGPKTREAIMRYQRDNGMQPTGEVSLALSELLLTPQQHAALQPAAVPVARPGLRPAVAQEPTATMRVRVEAADAAPLAQAALATLGETTIQEIKDAALVARIQIGLLNFGENGITVDGVMDEATAQAIRRFQGRYGLDVDGVPGDDLLIKMEEIGALKKS